MPKHIKDSKGLPGFDQEMEWTFTSVEELARKAVRNVLQNALESEVTDFLGRLGELRMADGKQAAVRNGYHKPRDFFIGTGLVNIEVPRTRNRMGGETFHSSIIPRYMRRSLKMEEAIPMLYLYGISETDMMPALRGLFGEAVKGLSPGSIARLREAWQKERKEWNLRKLDGKRFCYVWVDGIYFNAQGRENDLCTLVMIGVNEQGEKEVIAVEEGLRESSETWGAILRALKERGLQSPKLFIGDGSLGFWKAAREVFPEAASQRCWVHKTRNILGNIHKTLHGKAKEALALIYQAPDRQTAMGAVAAFGRQFGAKYPKAQECLEKDLDVLLTFFDFPAEHWIHIRSTNAIESTFSTVRLRTTKMKGCGSPETIMTMVYKLLEKASGRWRKLRGPELVAAVLNGQAFKDGIPKAA
jgi:transposase-like protein